MLLNLRGIERIEVTDLSSRSVPEHADPMKREQRRRGHTVSVCLAMSPTLCARLCRWLGRRYSSTVPARGET